MVVHTDVSPGQPYEKKCLLRSVQIYGVLIAWHVKRWGLAALIGWRATGSLSDCKNLVADWGRAARLPTLSHDRRAGVSAGAWGVLSLALSNCVPNSAPWQRGNTKDISGYMFSS